MASSTLNHAPWTLLVLVATITKVIAYSSILRQGSLGLRKTVLLRMNDDTHFDYLVIGGGSGGKWTKNYTYCTEYLN